MNGCSNSIWCVFLYVRGEFSHGDGRRPESSWHQLRWDAEHTQVELRQHVLCCSLLVPHSCWMSVWRTLMTGTPESCVTLHGLHQFPTLKRAAGAAGWKCGFVMSGVLWLCPSDPSLTPTGMQTAPNRFAVTPWSMRIPITDWCASWRRRCLVWKISSTPRAWVTSLRVRGHSLC